LRACVEDHHGGAGFVARDGNLFGLAAPEQGGRIGRRAILHRAQYDVGPRSGREAGQFVEDRVGVGLP
jgi:hypothetical protein